MASSRSENMSLAQLVDWRETAWAGRIELPLASPEHQIAQRVARHSPGPAAAPGLRVVGDSLSSFLRVFFERAFADCKQIEVRRLAGGRAQVFSVYAILA